MRRYCLIAVLVSALTTPAWSTELTQTVTFGPDSAGVTTARPAQAAVSLSDDQLKLVVTCTGGLDCGAVGVGLVPPNGGKLLKVLQGDSASRAVVIPKTEVSSGTWKVEFTYNRIDVPSGAFTLTAAGAAAAPVAPAAAAPTTPSLASLLTYPCSISTTLAAYDLKGNVAHVIVTPLGRVISSNADAFDENDTLRVTVIVHPDLKSRLKVERTSAFRDRTEIRILGEGAERDQIRLESAVPCVPVTFELGDFAPGRGEVRISVLSDTLESQAVGSFDLYVDPLYIGIFSAGPIWTRVVDPEIGLVSNGTETVIGVQAQSEHDLRYGVFFTPFVWGRRDTEKDRAWYREHDLAYPFWRHINPTIGFPFDDVGDNALVGISVDLPRGFVLSYGKHVGEIRTLDPDSSLDEGSPFTGTAEDLPLVKDRIDDEFVAVSLDLRVFVRLLRTVVSGTPK